MNNNRMRAVEAGLNGTARKVLAAIPMQDAWTAQQIHSEIARTSTPMERRFVDGCIRLIVDNGLAREVRTGHFQRIAPKPETASMPTEPKLPTEPAAARAADPLQRLGGIASSLREHGRQQAALFSSLADQIDEAALLLDKQAEAGKKLKQLLQEIG